MDILKSTLIFPSAICKTKKDLWLLQANSNLLIRIDYDKNEIVATIRIDEVSYVNHRDLGDRIIELQDELIVYVKGYPYIFTVNTITNTIKVLTDIPGEVDYNISDMIFKERKAFFFNQSSNKVSIYDFTKKEWEIMQTGAAEISFPERVYSVGGDIVFMDKKTNSIVEYDCINNRVKNSISSGSDDCLLWAVKVDGKYVAQSLRDNTILIIDDECGAKERMTIGQNGFVFNPGTAFIDQYVYGKLVFLFPRNANRILVVDTEKNLLREGFSEMLYDECYDYENSKHVSEAFLSTYLENETVYAYTHFRNRIQMFDLSSEGAKERPELVINDNVRNALQKLFKNGESEELFFEGRINQSFHGFLDSLMGY